MRLAVSTICLRLISVLVLTATVACPAKADGQGNQLPAVVIVRHAERADDSDNSPLSEAGKARAQALALALKDAGVKAIVVTDKIRTQQTAQPLATQLGIQPTKIPSTVSEHAKAVADAVRSHPATVVLVVGHSNSVPDIISQLCGPHGPQVSVGPVEYSNLYLLVPVDGHFQLIHAHYGKSDP